MTICPYCFQEIAVESDGTLAVHPDTDLRWIKLCRGSKEQIELEPKTEEEAT